jgi:23S rRNA (adenine2503-C2)-methyltransferase
MPIHVNLIPLNDVSERSYQKSGTEAVAAFGRVLNARGINATVRRRLGPDINASCGQLRYNGQEQA